MFHPQLLSLICIHKKSFVCSLCTTEKSKDPHSLIRSNSRFVETSPVISGPGPDPTWCHIIIQRFQRFQLLHQLQHLTLRLHRSQNPHHNHTYHLETNNIYNLFHWITQWRLPSSAMKLAFRPAPSFIYPLSYLIIINIVTTPMSEFCQIIPPISLICEGTPTKLISQL